MSSSNSGPAGERLLGRLASISAAVDSALHPIAVDHPSLIAGVRRLLDSDGSVRNTFRLLPFPLLGALSADEELAVPLAVLSRIWWTGAEVLDDLADGDFSPALVGLSLSQASIASTACLTLVPQWLIERQDLPGRVRQQWRNEFADGSLHAAEGQLEDVSAGAEPASWGSVMRVYVGKSGAPYGRDAAMAAMVAGADDTAVRGWRAFGRLFGVLRQLANDGASALASRDEDLLNGTSTLLLALARERLEPDEADALTALRTRAMEDAEARRVLRARLARPDVASAYRGRVDVVRGKLSDLLRELTAPSEHRDLIQWMIDDSALDARALGPAEAA